MEIQCHSLCAHGVRDELESPVKGLGGLDIRTPVLDELASEGLRVTQAYSNSPVCTPSRAAILTGRYPFALGLRWIIEQNRPRLG